MSRISIPITKSYDMYRTQFPDGNFYQYRPWQQENPTFAIISTSRCNLQSLHIYAAQSMGDGGQSPRWLHIYDNNINNDTNPDTPTPISALQGKHPSFPPALIGPGCSLEWCPCRDIKLEDYDTGIAFFLGQPFDLGIIALVSTTEFTTNLSGNPLDRIATEAMVYIGQAGRIDCK